MPTCKLTNTFVLTAFCPEGKKKIDYYDDRITGFVYECRANGQGTYGLRYRDKHGRQRQYKIGSAADLTCDQARKVATKIRSRVVMGENPAEERQVTRTIPTIDQLATRYLEYVRGYKRSHDIDARYLKHHILPRFGRMRLDEVQQGEVVEWLHAKVKKEGYAPATVNRLHVVLSYMYKLAKCWGIPGAEVNPLFGVKLSDPDNNRERFLTPAETERLRSACAASDNTQLAAIVGLLLFTGARKRELLDAKWDHVDFEKRLWLIPTTKTGKSRKVPLSNGAIQILRSLPRWDRCPYVVPNPKTKKPYHSIYNSWDRARRLACLPDVRLHDRRHSAASNMVNAGQSLYAVGTVLGHTQPKTTQRYAHLSQETLLAAVNAGEGVMGTDWSGGASAAA